MVSSDDVVLYSRTEVPAELYYGTAARYLRHLGGYVPLPDRIQGRSPGTTSISTT